MRTLREDDFDAIHACFNAAFSDYAIPFSLTPTQLRSMMTRRGWTPDVSVGDLPRGFVLNCVDGVRGYDMGTGVVPDARRSGLAQRLMERSIELLSSRGVREYVLEVISTNEKAVRLYEKLGFETVRELDCWTLPNAEVEDRRPRLSRPNETWWDFAPSWQNSSASVRRASEAHVVLGDEHGYLILFPENGDVPQFAVDPAHRRGGLGRALFAAAASQSSRPLRVLNIDPSLAPFMTAIGATKLITQLEMVKPLSPASAP